MTVWMNPMELNVGDKVGIYPEGHYALAVFATVTRKMVNQIELSDGSRWSKNGREIGKGGHYMRRRLTTVADAEETNAARAAESARRHDLARISNTNFRSLNDADLARIVALLDKIDPPKTAEEPK